MTRAMRLAWVLALAATAAIAQAPINPRLLDQPWPAQWIAPPGAPPFGYGVYHFRKAFTLAEGPREFVIHVSADNRYRLFVNGHSVAAGPAQSDLRQWRFESLDIARHLRAGTNILAAVVWNGAEHKPMAQISHRTGFLLVGNGERQKAVNTGKTWKTFRDPAYSPIPWRDNDQRLGWQYYVAGANERVDGTVYPWGWQDPEYDDSGWAAAEAIDAGAPAGVESHQKWQLVPSPVPLLAEAPQRFARVAKVQAADLPQGFLTSSGPWTLPAQSRATILLDQGVLTTGYPILVVSHGRGALIRATYTEALYGEKGEKGNRQQIEGKKVIGVYDEWIADGGEKRVFRPLWVRTWRYLQLEIETRAEPVTIEDVRSDRCAYPAERKASFVTDRAVLKDIWDAGWGTLQLGAQDVFVSDLYWERIQYVGDTKLQVLSWLAATGDDRLYRQALQQFDSSRAPFGLTQSRYPADLEQFTPLYSLVWITMVHDFWRYRDDDAFVRQFLPGIQQVLGWFERQKTRDGLIPPLFQLDFVDSSYGQQGQRIIKEEGHPGMAPHSLFYVMALENAAEFFARFGQPVAAAHYRKEAAAVRSTVHRLCWDNQRELFSDTPAKKYFSQHANILAILAGALPAKEQPALLDRLLADRALVQIEMYFRFYLGRALNKTGQGDRYIDNLKPWEEMLASGMTTFGETHTNPRSECHPWSATPVYEFLTTVAGILPSESGFKSVRIAPSMGSLRHLEASMPHPLGPIELALDRSGQSGLSGTVRLPEGLQGEFVWHGRKRTLNPGETRINEK